MVEPESPSAPIHIALIGSTSAGKTTLARGVVRACRSRGVEAWLSEDFAARQVGIHWIRSGFARRRLIELASLGYCLVSWRRYREFHALSMRLIREAPGSWLYKAGLLRLTLRKTGIHEIVRRRARDGQIVVSDNEPALQGAHHLFVHPDGARSPSKLNGGDPVGVETFAELAPLTDVVVYLRTPEQAVIDRTLRRGHRRLGSESVESVRRMVRGTVDVFERLSGTSSLRGRLLVSDGCRVYGPENADGSTVRSLAYTARLLEEGLVAARASRVGRSPGRRSPEPLSDTSSQLLDRLNQDGIEYCSLMSDPSSPEGQQRLTLLVDPSALGRVRRVLAELDMKEVLLRRGSRTPGEWHYYGFSPSTGGLTHIHLLSRVLVGPLHLRTHRLPLEAMLLDNVETEGPLPEPAGAAELVLFVLRSFIEPRSAFGGLASVEDRTDARAVLRLIESRCSIPEAVSLLKMHCPPLGEGLFLDCLGALHNEAGWVRRSLLSRTVRRRLRQYRTGGAAGRLGSIARFFRYGGRGGVSRVSERVWHSGGALIAFVGPDATGKSTLAGETARWLGGACGVRVVHLGKPSSSPWTLPINIALRSLRALRGRRPRWKPDAPAESTRSRSGKRAGWSLLIYAVRAVVLAVDRRRAVNSAWLSATRGGVVVCDRYPTAQLGAMDGPRLDPGMEAHGVRAAIYWMLSRWESRVYRGLPQPDVLIRLTVSVETAKERNRRRDKADKHTDEDLESRHQSLGTWNTREDRCRDVSTEGTLEETLSRVKNAIWEVL